jgi:hypothetical protein
LLTPDSLQLKGHHELCILGKLDLAKYSTRWLDRRTLNASISSVKNQLPMALPQLNPLTLVGDNQARAVEDGDTTFGTTLGDTTQNLADDTSDDDVPPSQLGPNAVTEDGKLTYQFVAGKATNLMCLAQSDPATLCLLCNMLDQLAGRHIIDVQAYDAVVPVGKENPGSVPLLGTLRAAPNMYNQRRKVYKHENRRQIVAKKGSVSVGLTGQSNDLGFLPEPGTTKTKACSISKCPGHQHRSCPKIHKFNKPPLGMNEDVLSRRKLSSALSKVGCYTADYLPTNNLRPISSSTPVSLLGVVIHRRFFRNHNSNKSVLSAPFLTKWEILTPHSRTIYSCLNACLFM